MADIINFIVTIFLDIRHNAIVSDLYSNYQYFEVNIDKATQTLPEYVDYEVLFDKNEIKKGIPILYAYLQKRAEEEQRELERARLRNVEHEKFNFDEAGIESSLVLDRAMQEAENYIAERKKYMEDMQQINGEIISADSMQVYKSMDIATAKATPEEQAQAPHQLLDICHPSQPFSVAAYHPLHHPKQAGQPGIIQIDHRICPLQTKLQSPIVTTEESEEPVADAEEEPVAEEVATPTPVETPAVGEVAAETVPVVEEPVSIPKVVTPDAKPVADVFVDGGEAADMIYNHNMIPLSTIVEINNINTK